METFFISTNFGSISTMLSSMLCVEASTRIEHYTIPNCGHLSISHHLFILASARKIRRQCDCLCSVNFKNSDLESPSLPVRVKVVLRRHRQRRRMYPIQWRRSAPHCATAGDWKIHNLSCELRLRPLRCCKKRSRENFAVHFLVSFLVFSRCLRFGSVHVALLAIWFHFIVITRDEAFLHHPWWFFELPLLTVLFCLFCRM